MGIKPFDEVVTEHGAMVMRVCRSLLDPVAADDAWSDTFLAALRTYPELRSNSNIAGWLATIAYRKSIDQIRGAKRAAGTPAREQPTGAEAPPEFDPVLRDTLNELAPKQRAAVVYRYLVDLSYLEIARLLDITEAAARRNAADGVARLRTHYLKGSQP